MGELRPSGDETDAASYSEPRARAMSSGRSSSESWPGGRERGADIIDLDRYMRGSVRPLNRHRNDADDRLVVDAGGPTAVGGLPLGGSLAVGSHGGAPSPRPKSSSTTSAPKRDKRYSHDSGLSDGSYVRRRTHRRVMGENATIRAHREREREREHGRTGSSSNSMRTFRAACERALRDQQEQIARVAQLCERLTVKTERGGGAAPRQTSVTCTQDSSDISSSSISRSTRDNRRKDKHRSDECKTYKIIMNKLDELNRLFAARARSTPPPRRAVPPAPRTSSGSVSVSDKLVCTEPQPTERHHVTRPPKSVVAYAALTDVRPVLVSPRTPQSVAHPTVQRRSPQLVERGVGGEQRGGRGVIARLAAVRAHELSIAPAEALQRAQPARTRCGRLNVATESVVECESDDTGSMEGPCKFDLDNPVHKQRTRAHSLDYDEARMRFGDKTHEHTHYMSLCGRCQGYWRALSTMATQLFSRNDS